VFSYGVKANLAIGMAMLIGVAMVLIDVVVTMAAQHLLLRAEKQKAAALLTMAGTLMTGAPGPEAAGPIDRLAAAGQDRAAGLLTLGLIDSTGFHVLQGPSDGPWEAQLTRLASQARESDRTQNSFYGRTWGVFKSEPKWLLMAMPLGQNGKPNAAVAAACPLGGVYKDLRQIQTIFLIYMGINLVVLTGVGFKRFRTIVFKPIARLVKAAEEYRPEGPMAFGQTSEKSEFGRLSLSLNRMLRRIAHDKKRLETMVASLEEANGRLHQAHQEILRAEKLAVIGRLSAGIAHEIGNPVSIVMGYLALLRQEDLPAQERREFLRRTEVEVNRIDNIIGALLNLARPSAEKRRPVAVHQIIQRVRQLVQGHPLMAGIDLEIHAAAAADTVMADGDQIHQVVLNLLLNAADAIAGGPGPGRVDIATVNPAAGDAGSPPRMVQITVADNGSGIAADQLDLVFDPFYTTKEPGRGTGLGLAVSSMIIQAHGGTLTAESPPGQGARFTIALPLCPQEADG
jgi:signal transduction histidine kinase